MFAQGDTGWFVPTLRKLTVLLVNLALKVRCHGLVTPAPADPRRRPGESPEIRTSPKLGKQLAS